MAAIRSQKVRPRRARLSGPGARRCDGNDDAHKVHGKGDQTFVAGEKDAGYESVDGHAGATGHEWRNDDRQAPVPLRFQCTRRHHGRHGAAKPHQHRDETAAGQPDFLEKFICDESSPRHVAGVFKQRKKEKQQGDLGQECQYAADTCQNTTDKQ